MSKVIDLHPNQPRERDCLDDFPDDDPQTAEPLGTLIWVGRDGLGQVIRNVEPGSLSFEFWRQTESGMYKIRHGAGCDIGEDIPF